jgi:hypothetical protein
MINTEFKNIELAPITNIDTEATGICKRFIGRTKAAFVVVKVAMRGGASEADAAFQRAMLPVVGRQRFNPDSNPAYTQHSHADVGIHHSAHRESGATSEAPFIPADSRERLVIRGKQQLRTLYHLLHAKGEEGIPASELAALVGAGNQWEIVRQLRQKIGKDAIQRTDLLVTSKTGKATYRANYLLTSTGKRITAGILDRSGYSHDAASDIGHLRRPGMVAWEFLSESPIGDDDMLLLRDGTKPQWLRLLYLLRVMKGEWVPRYVADELLDSRNVRDAVLVANKKLGGQAIESTMRTMLNRDGGVCAYGLYRLADGWVFRVGKAIRMAGMAK